MAVFDDIKEWMEFCDELAFQMDDFKSSDFKQGMAEGVRMAANMLREYMVEYPEFNDPKANK